MLVLEIWFLLIQMKRGKLGSARTLSEASWLSTFWESASQFWSWVFHSHFSYCSQQGNLHTPSWGIDLKLLPSLKTYVQRKEAALSL